MEEMPKDVTELITNKFSNLQMDYYHALSQKVIAEVGMIELMKMLLSYSNEITFDKPIKVKEVENHNTIMVKTISLTEKRIIILNNDKKSLLDFVFGGHMIWLLQAVMETMRIPLFPQCPKDIGSKYSVFSSEHHE